MAHITVPDEPTATTFTVTTAQSVFVVTWTCFAKADIRVRVGSTELTQADFTFTGNPGTEGGFDGATITLNTAVSSTTVVIWRDIPVARTEDFGPGPVSSRDRNTALDRLTGMIQDREREGREALRVPAGETAAALPAATDRASRFLAFGADGQPIASPGAVTGVAVSAFAATLLDDASASAARDTLGAAPVVTAAPVEVTARKRWFETAFFSPLATIPSALGVGEPPVLTDTLGRQALNEAWLRGHIQLLVNKLGMKRIVVAQTEFGGYHWIMPPAGQSWPDRLSPATGKPVWYWTLVGGDKSAYLDIDLVNIIFDEAARLGASVVVGTSRFDDIELLNDDFNVRIGFRPLSNLTVPTGVTGTQTITANLATFALTNIGRVITPESGPGRAVITGFTDAQTVTVNITQAFTSGTLTADNWRFTIQDPNRYGLTLAARMTRAVDATRQLASWVVARWGNSPAFRGFYSAHEPDSLEGTAEFFGRCWTGAGTYPALSTYTTVDGQRIEWWMAPASPIDNFYSNVGRLRAALIASGVSHLAEQDSVGPGTNRITGAYAWVAGQATTLDQLYASHVAYRNILAGTGIEFVGHSELWEMAGPAYDKPYPAAPARLLSQWAYGQALTHSSSIYSGPLYLAEPTDILQPPLSTTGSATWRTRAHDLTAGLIAEYRDRSRKARAFTAANVSTFTGTASWSAFGGAFTTTLGTVTPWAEASVMDIQVALKLNRTGAAGAATGYVECSLIVDGVEGTRIRAMQDDDRADFVLLTGRTRAIGAASTIQVRLDNQLIAGTAPTATANWTVRELVG